MCLTAATDSSHTLKHLSADTSESIGILDFSTGDNIRIAITVQVYHHGFGLTVTIGVIVCEYGTTLYDIVVAYHFLRNCCSTGALQMLARQSCHVPDILKRIGKHDILFRQACCAHVGRSNIYFLALPTPAVELIQVCT